MLTLKSKREIAIMKEAGRIVELAHIAVRNAAKPGVSTLELDKIAYDVITSYGATPSFLNYNGFPNSICACFSSNSLKESTFSRENLNFFINLSLNFN